jgi:hypothetical protein
MAKYAQTGQRGLRRILEVNHPFLILALKYEKIKKTI